MLTRLQLHGNRRAPPPTGERGLDSGEVSPPNPSFTKDSPFCHRPSVFGNLGLTYLGAGPELELKAAHSPFHGLDALTGLTNAVPSGWRRVEREEMKDPPKPSFPVALGETIRARVGRHKVDGIFRGFDFKGRPLVEVGGKVRTTSLSRLEVPDTATIVKGSPSYEGVFASGGVLQPPAEVRRFLMDSLKQKVVGKATAFDCMKWLREQGHEVYLVGGGVRDLLREYARDPNLSADRAMALLQDVDLVGTATAQEAAQMFQAMNPVPNTSADAPTERGGIFGYFEQLGIVMAGGPKGGEPHGKGLDYAQMKITDFSGPAVMNEDTGERTVPVAFGPSLKANAYWRDSNQNSLYFDPFNEVVLDPTGSGVEDAQKGMFRYVHGEAADEPTVFLRFWKFRLRGHQSDDANIRATLDNAEKNLSKIPGQVVGFGAYEMYSMAAGYPSAKDFLHDLKRVIHEDELKIGDRTNEQTVGIYERHFEPVEKELSEFLDKLKADGGPSPFEKFKELLA